MASTAALEDNTWPADAQVWIAAQAKDGLIFSADDMRVKFRQAPRGSMVGQAFRKARLRGVITTHGFKESRTASRKAAVIRTWTGTTQGDTK